MTRSFLIVLLTALVLLILFHFEGDFYLLGKLVNVFDFDIGEFNIYDFVIYLFSCLFEFELIVVLIKSSISLIGLITSAFILFIDLDLNFLSNNLAIN